MDYVDKDYIYGTEDYERLTIEELNIDGAYALVGAIAKMAVKDYETAILTGNENKIKECERFFKSKYFESLSNLDGNAIIEKVRRDILDQKIKKEEKKRKHTNKRLRIGRFSLDGR